MNACLDSWAVLRWLEGVEPAAGRVEELLPRRPIMSWINLGEVWYVLAREVGRESAETTVGHLRHHLTLDDATPERVLHAAAIKAVHPLAYADAFALATAAAHEVPLLTGDPEILALSGVWPIEDIR